MNYERHGMKGTKIYSAWCNMKTRCYNQNTKDYQNYGGRGISVCPEWTRSFSNFLQWSIENGYKEGLSLDRIDNDKGYYPENCRWVTRDIQNTNKRGYSKNTSGFTGVHFAKREGRWEAQVRSGGKLYFIGYYEDGYKAALARDKFIVCNKLRNKLNFPEQSRGVFKD